MNLEGPLSFALGGTMLIFVFYNIILHPQLMGYDESVVLSWIVQNALFGFIGFLLVGLGLWLIIRDARRETKQNP